MADQDGAGVISGLAAKSALVLGTVAVSAGATLVLVPAGGAQTVAQAWVDAPLSGSVVPDGPVTLTVHAADPDGISTIVLELDGDQVGAAKVDGAPTLATADIVWEPTVVGAVTLEAIGVDAGGHRGRGGVIELIVGRQAQPGDLVGPVATSTTVADPDLATTTTAPIGATTTPAPTSTRPTPSTGPPPPPTTATTSPTTTTACTVQAPTLLSPANGTTTPLSSPTLRWSYSASCDPSQFRVQVSGRVGFESLVSDQVVGGDQRSWQVQPPLSCATWYWRVIATDRSGSMTSAVWSFTVSYRGC